MVGVRVLVRRNERRVYTSTRLHIFQLVQQNHTRGAGAADLDAKVLHHRCRWIGLIWIVEQLCLQDEGRIGHVAADVMIVVAWQLQVATVPELVPADRLRLDNLHVTPEKVEKTGFIPEVETQRLS